MPNTAILGEGYAYTECPRWHNGRLWFVDMHLNQVIAIDPTDGKREVVTEVPGRTGGIGWLPDGRLLVVQQDARKIFRLENSGLVLHADLSAEVPSMLNDMWVDSNGHAWVGEMGFDPHEFLARPEVVAALTAETVEGPLQAPATSRVFVVKPDGSWRVAASDFVFTNGVVIDEKRRKLIVAETIGARLSIFDIVDGETLQNRRVWSLGFAPDGIALDAGGGVWVADPMHMCARHIVEGTEIARVSTEQLCLACAVGGPKGDTLYLCTSPTTEVEQGLALLGSRIEARSI
ncbi:sugar lactone lactonase YvrE [Tamaricihabitans halophyticus]|uniref:Sugar lactone lactonase YvrE n=1 Tax=Tamaricihabitans halophyticus TaxID=1262583 RepID=A0A4R2QDX4_9PSEU|nr:SMP-30/gluconolactonase/LRE family protein [Tamaricihabitans halophyticus]TCP47262.1 sugar lactone lactonase YvrE [Tamaricihabitans halophyticus]